MPGLQTNLLEWITKRRTLEKIDFKKPQNDAKFERLDMLIFETSPRVNLFIQNC